MTEPEMEHLSAVDLIDRVSLCYQIEFRLGGGILFDREQDGGVVVIMDRHDERRSTDIADRIREMLAENRVHYDGGISFADAIVTDSTVAKLNARPGNARSIAGGNQQFTPRPNRRRY